MRNGILLCLCMFLFGSTCCLAGSLSKEAQKSYKKVCKQLKKDGWAAYDKSLSLEDAMMTYYQQIEAGAGSMQQIIGMGRDKHPDMAYRQAQHHASVAQASEKGVNVKVATEMILSSSSGSSTDVSTFTHVEQTIKGLTPIASLYRKLKDGTTEVNLYYLCPIGQ